MEISRTTYCLYSDENQTQLLACADTKEEINEKSQYYTEGQWFEYDVEVVKGTDHLHNERKYNYSNFPIEAKPRDYGDIKGDERIPIKHSIRGFAS